MSSLGGNEGAEGRVVTFVTAKDQYLDVLMMINSIRWNPEFLHTHSLPKENTTAFVLRPSVQPVSDQNLTKAVSVKMLVPSDRNCALVIE